MGKLGDMLGGSGAELIGNPMSGLGIMKQLMGFNDGGQGQGQGEPNPGERMFGMDGSEQAPSDPFGGDRRKQMYAMQNPGAYALNRLFNKIF